MKQKSDVWLGSPPPLIHSRLLLTSFRGQIWQVLKRLSQTKLNYQLKVSSEDIFTLAFSGLMLTAGRGVYCTETLGRVRTIVKLSEMK